MRYPGNNGGHVYVRLIGGLGNQMFQYAAGRALALRHNAELKLDLTGFETYGLRRYELGSHSIVATIAAPAEIAVFDTRPVPTRSARFFNRFRSPRSDTVYLHYREPHFVFDPNLARMPLPILMDGYWQCERYFADAKQLLLKELSPIASMEPANLDIASEIDAANAVSLHVRRGDYVSNAHTSSYHGVCSLDYYRAAIEHVRQRVASPRLFIFSDDHDWTRENLRSELPTTYVTANPPDRGYRDLQLMSRCKHNIIANSSFSWWGAWLNPHSEKIVVAPARWFAASHHDTRDLVPSSWARL